MGKEDMDALLGVLESLDDAYEVLVGELADPKIEDNTKTYAKAKQLKELIYRVINKTTDEVQRITAEAAWTAAIIYTTAQNLLLDIDKTFEEKDESNE